MEIPRWTRLLNRERVMPLFVQIGGPAVAAPGVMSFSCARDEAEATELVRALTVDGLIVSGIDVLPIGLAVAKSLALPILVCGATPAEDRTLARLLPSQYADRRQRLRFIAVPDAALAVAVRQIEFERTLPQAKLRNRLRNRHDAWSDIARTFPAFAANAALRARHDQGYLLQPSGNVQTVASHSYRVVFSAAQSCDRVTVVPIVESPKSRGTLVMELISPTGAVTRSETRLDRLCAFSAVEFAFPAVAIEAGSNWEVRLSVRDGEQPVRLLEMRRYRLGGGRVDLQPYAIFGQS